MTAAFDAGPFLSDGREVDWSKVHPEHQEAVLRSLVDDLTAAIHWYADRARDVRDGRYDESYYPMHEGIVTTMKGKRHIFVTAGLRKPLDEGHGEGTP